MRDNKSLLQQPLADDTLVDPPSDTASDDILPLADKASVNTQAPVVDAKQQDSEPVASVSLAAEAAAQQQPMVEAESEVLIKAEQQPMALAAHGAETPADLQQPLVDATVSTAEAAAGQLLALVPEAPLQQPMDLAAPAAEAIA